MRRYLLSFAFAIIALNAYCQNQNLNTSTITTVLKGVNLIDGTGNPEMKNVTVVIKKDTIAEIITDSTKPVPRASQVINMKGKTIMPEIYTVNGHLGIIHDTSTGYQFFTAENINKQLKKYHSYGVGGVLSLGTDQPLIYAIRDSIRRGQLRDDPTVFTAGFGFGVPHGEPAENMSDKVFRPANRDEIKTDMDELRRHHVDVVMLWPGDGYGGHPKMRPEIYREIIMQAHKSRMRVLADASRYNDAKALIEAGVDGLASSITDRNVDDKLIAEMKKRKIVYIPALSGIYYNVAYTENQKWMDDPIFKAALEPGVLDMLTSKAYKEKLKKDYNRNKAALDNALINVKNIYQSGVTVLLGTNSGSQPVMIQGFSEQMELQLMVYAGLTPVEAINCASENNAEFLHIDKYFGTLRKGKKANFIALDKDPVDNIRNTGSIRSVWQYGRGVSGGPVNERHREERDEQRNGQHGTGTHTTIRQSHNK